MTERKGQKQVKFRVDDDEYQYLYLVAEELGTTIPKLAKSLTLGMKYKAPKVNAEDAKLIAYELRKYGSNLNQLAKHSNSKSSLMPSSSQGIKTELQKIERALIKIWEQF